MAQSVEQMVETLRAALSVNPKDAWKRLRLGKLLARLGQHEEAFDAFRRTLRDDPRLVDGHVALAKLHEERGETEDQERELLAGLALDENHVEAAFELARMRARQTRHEEALELLGRIERNAPRQPRVLRAQAANEGALGRWDRSLVYLEQALELAPDDLLVREQLGLAYVASARWRRAVVTLEEVVAADPRRTDAQRGLLRTLLELERGEAALATAEALLAIDADDDDARAGKAAALVKLGRAADALPLFDGTTVEPQAAAPLCRALVAVGRGVDAVRRAQEVAQAHPDSASAQATLGEVLAAVGRDEEAIAPLRQALRLDATTIEAEVALARVYTRLGRDRDALEALERACEARPVDATLLVLRGDAEVAAGLIQKAEATFAQAAALDDTSVAARLGLARSRAALGRAAEAIAAYRDALDLEPGRGDAWLERGRLEHGEGRHDDAVRSLTSASEKQPDPADAIALLGEAQFALGRLPAAIAAFRRVVELRPEDAGQWFALGRAYAQARRGPEAIAALQRAVQIDESFGEAFYLLGREEAAARQDEAAVQDLQAAVRLLPNEVGTLSELGLALARLGRWRPAVDALGEAVGRGARGAPVLATLARGCLELQQASEAERWFGRVLELEPAVADHYAGRGAALLAMGRPTEAEAAFREAVRIAPEHARAQQELGRLEWARGDQPAALPRLRRAAEGLVDVAVAWRELGELALALDEAREAERAYRRFLELCPGEVEGVSGLARALEAGEIYPEAIENYRRSCALRPEDSEDRRRLGLLLARLGRDEEAILELDPALQGVDDPLSLEVLADCLLRTDRHEAAAAVLERAIGEREGQFALHAKAGLAYERVGREGRAKWHLERARAGGDPEVLDGLGRLYLSQARRQLGAHEVEPAVESYEAAATLRPQDVELRWELGRALRRVGRAARAEEIFEESTRLAPRDGRFPLARGELALEAGRADVALKFFEAVLALDASHGEAQRGRARALVAAGRADDAIAQYRGVLEARPDATEERAVLGELLLDANRPAEALPVLSDLASLRPLDGRALRLLGTCQHRLGRHDEAVACLARALERDGDHDPTRRMLATSYVRLERWSEALPVLESIGVAEPVWLDEMFGRTYAALGRDAEAVEHLRDVVEQRPEPELLELLARCALGAGDPTTGRRAALRLLQERPQDTEVLRLVARAERALGDHDAEAQAWQQLLATRPEDEEARQGRADLLRRAASDAEIEIAVERLREVVDLWPADPEPHHELARLLESLGDAQGALAVVRHGISVASPDAQLLAHEGLLLNATGTFDLARDAFARALAVDSRYVPALSAQADVLLQLGDASRAVSLLEDLLDVTPEDAGAWRRLASLQRQLDRHRAAVDAFGQLQELTTLTLDERETFGLCAVAAGQLGPARGLLTGVVAELPDRVDLVLALAHVERDLGDLEASLGTLEAGVRRAPGETALLIDFARAQGACGQWEAAHQTYERACSATPTESWLREWCAAASHVGPEGRVQAFSRLTEALPEDASAAHELGLAWRDAQRGEAAATALERAYSLAPQDGAIARDLAAVELALAVARVPEAPDMQWLSRAVDHAQDEPDLLAQAARLFRRAGDLAAARDAARAAVDGAPQDVAAAVLLGEIDEEDGELERAARQFERALRIQVDAADGLHGLARVELALARPQASSTAERLVALLPHDEAALVLSARALEAAGSRERAAERWRTALSRFPEQPLARGELGRLLGELDRHRERIDLLGDYTADSRLALMLARSWLAVGEPGRAAGVAPVGEADSCAAEGHAVRGEALAALGEDVDAVAAFGRACQLGYVAAASGLTLAATRVGRSLPWDRATVLLRGALQHVPEAASLWGVLAERELEGGQTQPALEAAQQALAHGLGAEAWRLIGAAYERAGDARAAADAFASAAGSDPTDRAAVLGVARTRRAAGDHAAAVEALVQRVAEEPQDTEALGLLADSYDALGQLPDAVRSWQKLLAMGQLPAPDCSRLGQRCLELGRAEEAMDALEEALEATPDDGDLLAALGEARIGAGQPEQAVAPLEKAVRLGHLTVRVSALLARAHSACGRHAEAVEAMQGAAVADEQTARLLHDAAVRTGNDEVAAAALERLVEMTGDSSWRLELAEALVRLGRRRAAIDCLRSAGDRPATLNERLVALSLEEGREAQAQGEQERVRMILEALLDMELPPPSALSAARLAQAGRLLALERRAAERALAPEAAPECIHDAHLLLAELDEGADERAQALAHYQAAVDAKLDSVTALLGAAQCEAQVGSFEAGVVLLHRALKIDPTHGRARDLLRDWIEHRPSAELLSPLSFVVEAEAQEPGPRGELGRLLVRLGRPNDGAAHLRTAMDLGAGVEALVFLAELETELGEDRRAVAAAEKALSCVPGHSGAEVWRAVAAVGFAPPPQLPELLAQIDPAVLKPDQRERLATRLAQRAGELDAAGEGGLVEAIYAKVEQLDLQQGRKQAVLGARVAFDAGDLGLAARRARAAIEARPDDVEAHALLGEICVRAGADSEAIEAFAAALRVDRGHRQALRGHGLAAERLGQYETAYRSLGLALAREPTPELVAALARTTDAMGRQEETLALLRQLSGMRELTSTESHRLGSLSLEAGDAAAAVAHLEAVGEHPEPGRLWDLARARELTGNLAAAVADLQRLTRQAPGYPGLHGRLGTLMARSGDLAGALAEFELALEQEGESVPLLESLCDVCEKLGERAKVLRFGARLAELAPRAEKLEALGRARLEAGDPAGAIGALEQAREQGAAGAKGLLSTALGERAKQLAESGDAQAAIEHYRRALELDDARFDHWLELGLAEARVGEAAPAREHLMQAASSPDCPVAGLVSVLRIAERARDPELAIVAGEPLLGRAPSAAVARSVAYAHEALGRYPEAIRHYEQAIAGEPSDIVSMLAVVRLHVKLGDHAAALSAATRVTRLEPNNCVAQTMRADALVQTGRYADAIPILTWLMARDPQVETCVKLAHCHGATGQHKEQAAALEAGIQAAPDETRLVRQLGDVRARLGEWSGAIAAYERAHLLDPSDMHTKLLGNSILHIGQEALKAGQPESAVHWLLRARNTIPDRVDLLSVLIRAALAARQPALAHDSGERIFAMDPHALGPEVLFQLGRAADEAQQAKPARLWYQRLLGREPRHPGTLFRLGCLDYRAGAFRQAAEWLRQCMEADANHPLARAMLARTLIEAGAPLDAAKLVSAALHQVPNDGELREVLGIALARAQHYTPAVIELQRAAQLGRNTADLHFAWGECSLAQGDRRGAQMAFARALELRPQDVRTLLRCGTIALLMGRGEEATEYLRRAVQIAPREPRPRFELANAYLQTKRLEQARQEYDVLVGLDPELAARLRVLFPA